MPDRIAVEVWDLTPYQAKAVQVAVAVRFGWKVWCATKRALVFSTPIPAEENPSMAFLDSLMNFVRDITHESHIISFRVIRVKEPEKLLMATS